MAHGDGGPRPRQDLDEEAVDDRLRFQARLLEAVGEAVLATKPDGTITYWNAAAERLFGWTAGEAIGADVVELIHVFAAPGEAARILALLAAGQSYTGELVLHRRDGTIFHAHINDSPILDGDGVVTGVIGVTIDIGDRVKAEIAAQTRSAQAAAVAAVGELAVSQTNLSALLHRSLEHAVTALDADVGSILLAEGDVLRLHATVGLPAGVPAVLEVPTGDKSLAGFTLATDDPVVVVDLLHDGRFTPAPGLVESGAVSGITAVLRVAGRGAGVLSVYTREERRFDDHDVNVLRSIANAIAHVMERDEAQQHLSQIAVTDELTGLPNRVLFLDRLEHALRRTEHTVAVIFGDLDRFKEVNDALGHAAGDHLLRAVAGRLTASLQPTETVARFGGDEFAILSEDVADAIEAVALAERLAAAVASEPVLLDGREIRMTISMGVVVGDATCGDPAMLLRDADAAMYRAKEGGPGRVELFDERLRTSVVRRLDLRHELAAGLANGELMVHYQPEVELAGDLVWAEALVRWHHPERGLLAPDEFLDLAEDTGLIVTLGQYVLERAATQMARWARLPPGQAPSSVSVNISARQLVEGDLVALTAGLLSDLQLDPQSLWFELTETALLREPEQAIGTLHELKALGVGLAIDDFGTGYSSLAYARLLPVDALKIDRSFISGMGTDLRDRNIVRAMIGLARSFDILAIAEGVETTEQLDDLRSLGCHFAQGYLLSRPGEPEAIEAWVQARTQGG